MIGAEEDRALREGLEQGRDLAVDELQACALTHATDLGVVAKGWGRIQAYDSNSGTYSVNGAARRLLPDEREVFTLTSTS